MTINGQDYIIISENNFMPGRVEFKLRKPNGKRFYHVVRYEDGTMSGVV